MSISRSSSTPSKSHVHHTTSTSASGSDLKSNTNTNTNAVFDNPSHATTTTTMSKSRGVRHVPWAQHTLRQLKLVIPGAAITYYLGTLDDFWKILQGFGGSWAQLAGFSASGLGFTTVVLFLYVLLMPWITGEEPNYQTWRDSGILSSVIPVLTGSIVVGWLLAVSTLGHWSALGYVKGTIGVSAFYALTFGLLGLVPVPKVSRKRKL